MTEKVKPAMTGKAETDIAGFAFEGKAGNITSAEFAGRYYLASLTQRTAQPKR